MKGKVFQTESEIQQFSQLRGIRERENRINSSCLSFLALRSFSFLLSLDIRVTSILLSLFLFRKNILFFQKVFEIGHGGSYSQSQYFGRLRQVNHLRSGFPDLPDQHGETPSLLKIQNQLGVVVHACNPSYLGG